MAWFRVDDRLHDHRKVRRVRKSHPDKARDVAPFGLWALAGSWCGSTATGGFVPTEVLEEWDDEAEELAERLVDAGLWWHDEVDGEAGYRFHDWRDQNPHDGTDPGDYGRRGNHIRWHVKRDVIDPECDLCSPDESGRIGGDNRGESGGESSRPDPSRPDPTRTSDGDALAAEFDEWYSAYPRKKGRGQALKAYRGARKKAEAGVLLAAVQAQAAQLVAGGLTYAPYPATWLNGERWADEVEATQAAAAGTPNSGWTARVLPTPPPDIADDPERYEAWLAEQRRAG